MRIPTPLRELGVSPTLALFPLFLVLAAPALVVMDDVARLPGILWGTSIAFMTLFVGTVDRNHKVSRTVSTFIVFLFSVTNLLLSVSFKVQGVGFNPAFFAHLDRNTLEVLAQTESWGVFASFLYIGFAPAVAFTLIGCSEPRFFRAKGFYRKTAGALLLFLSVLTSYPVWSLVEYQKRRSISDTALLDQIAATSLVSRKTAHLSGNRRNLVLIYLESFEAAYLDDQKFPNLAPNIRSIADKGVLFQNIQQFPGTSWTVAGMVSSQCGVPLLTAKRGNRVLSQYKDPFRQITCLAEYLQDEGYDTVYIGGASLKFGGKAAFLADNGFNVSFGFEELASDRNHSWGLYDVDLFGHARLAYDKLSDGDAPFLLSLLTLDTHHPKGTPSPGCSVYDGDSLTMLQSVHCTDQLTHEFLQHIAASDAGPNTVIAIVSDHLVIYGEVEEYLEKHERELLFILIDREQEAGVHAGPASHFDIAPTLLDALGMPDAHFAFGHSLLSHKYGFVHSSDLAPSDFEPFVLEMLVKPEDSSE